MVNTVSDNLSLKTTLEGFSPQQFDALKQVATYYRLIRSLRLTGWENLFWGGLTLWLGASTSAMYPNIFSNIQAVLGFLIIAQSLWAISRPGINAFLALTVVLTLCGLWNLFIAFYGRFNSPDIFAGLLGAFQLWWAYRTYKSFQLFSELPLLTETPGLIQQYDDIWNSLAHPSPMLSPELVMLQINRNRNWWNGILLSDCAVMAYKRQKVLRVVSKSDLVIVSENPKSINRNKFGVFARIEKQSSMGRIYRASFQKYLAWKGITDPEAEVTKTIVRQRRMRKIVWWVMVVILFAIGLYVAGLYSFMMRYA